MELHWQRETQTHTYTVHTHTQPYDNSVKSTYIDTRKIGRIIFGERERDTMFIEKIDIKLKNKF